MVLGKATLVVRLYAVGWVKGPIASLTPKKPLGWESGLKNKYLDCGRCGIDSKAVALYNRGPQVYFGHPQLVWPDWAIFLTLGNFLKLLATINLAKSPTFLGNLCKGVKIIHFSNKIIFGKHLKTFGDFFWSPCPQFKFDNYFRSMVEKTKIKKNGPGMANLWNVTKSGAFAWQASHVLSIQTFAKVINKNLERKSLSKFVNPFLKEIPMTQESSSGSSLFCIADNYNIIFV